jgi:hypothetical protein
MNTPERDEVIRRLDRLEREGDRLRRSARRWREVGLIAVVGAAAAAVGAAGPGFQEDREASDPGAIVEEHRDLAARSLETINRSFERGVAESRLADSAYVFSCRMLSAELYLGLPEGGPRTMDPELYLTTGLAPSTPGRLASFEEHRDRMLRWEERFRPLARDRIVSPLAFAELQSRRLEAETWLARERLRAAPGAEAPPP